MIIFTLVPKDQVKNADDQQKAQQDDSNKTNDDLDLAMATTPAPSETNVTQQSNLAHSGIDDADAPY